MELKKIILRLNGLISILCLLFVYNAKAQSQATPQEYLCSLKATSANSNRVFIDIQDQVVLLGQGDDRYDLQPIFVGDHIVSSFHAQFRFMGSLYFDEEAQKNVLMIGLFRMIKDFRTRGQEHFWRPPQDDRLSAWLAVPVIEEESFDESEAEIVLLDQPISGSNTNIRNLNFSCRVL